MMRMADIFRNVLISEEMAFLSAIPAQAEPCTDNNIEGNCLPAEVNSNVDVEYIRESSYTRGLTDGIAQENARLHEQFNTLNRLLHSIPEAINNNRRLLAVEIADIVLLITQQFFIHQQQNRDSITHQITQVIDQLNNKQNINISLHPRDLALIQQDGIHIDAQLYKNLHLVPDNTLSLGGCLVKSEHGMFDAGIERQIDALKDVLLQLRATHE